MIDVEYQVYNDLTTALLAIFPILKTSSIYTNTPAEYPFVSIEQIDSSVNENAEDCCKVENAVNVVFEINVYTKGDDRKIVAKKIANKIDEYLSSIGFIRRSSIPLQDNDGTSYRINMRYEAVVDKNHNVYRR